MCQLHCYRHVSAAVPSVFINIDVYIVVCITVSLCLCTITFYADLYKLTALKFKCHYRNTSILFPFKLCTKKIVRKHARLYLNGGKITNVNDTHA